MRWILAAALAITASTTAYAQETTDTFAVKELVVSATRLPIERAASSASVTVLRANDLRTRGVRTVGEALRTVAGAALVQTGSYGAFASLFMRGGESDYVQVLIDGVQINSPGEHFDFGNLTLEGIDRIEVVRGPVSVLYGSDAVTGVIQLFTTPGTGGRHFDISAAGGVGNRVVNPESGSFGSSHLTAQLRGRAGRLGYSAGVSDFRSDGSYAFNNQNHNSGFTGRVSFAPDAWTDVAATVRLTRNQFHYPTNGAGDVVDANQQDVTDGLTGGVELGRQFGKRIEIQAQAGFNRNDDSYTDAPDNSADTTGFYAYYSDERFQRESADLRVNYFVAPRFIVTAGADYDEQRERGSNHYDSDFGSSDGASAEARNNRGVYAQLVGGASTVDFQAGARIDDNERFGTFSTYRGGFSVPMAKWLRLRASAGTGFKQPRFYEQFATGFDKGNPDLQPETSRSVEGGVELGTGRGRVTATYFAQKFRNLIQYVGFPAHPGDPNYLNLGGARADGAEIEATYPFHGLLARASYTIIKTEVTDAGAGDDPLFQAGEALIRRPKHSGALTLSYARSWWNASSTIHYVGERADLDFHNYPADRVILPAYARLDLAGEAAVTASGVKVTAKIENALNEGYEEIRSFPARRRVVFVGLRYNN